MGHHHISEVNDEKYIFTGRSKVIVGLVFLVGLILTYIGVNQIKHEEDRHNEAQTEEHASTAQDLPIHTASLQDGHVDHGDESHAQEHATHAEDAHPAEEAHGAKTADHADEAAADHGGGHGPKWLTRLWANLLLNAYYFMLFAVGALFFLAVNYAANAGWSTLLKRIIESISSYIPIGIISLVLVIYFGKEHLYHWVVYLDQGLGAGHPEFDKILDNKSWFLSSGWLLIGVPTIMVIWWIFRIVLVRLSEKEDQEGGLSYFKKSITYSALFLVIFAFSFSVLSWLVMMSIDPHWYSTMYSVYNFAIAFVTALTVICFFTLYLKSKGYMEVVSDEVIHDLGKFMFAFSIFWGYIFICQFMLIWYANITEESIYFAQRLTPNFKWFFRTNVIMCFALPFLVLMMRNAKRNPKVLLVAGACILLGHWLDLFLMIMPGTVGQTAKIGMLEVGLTMTFAGVFIFWVLNNLSKKSLYTKNHPYLLESANHDVGV